MSEAPQADAPRGDPPTIRGFVLQPTYRVVGGRAVIHLHGRLETGETFLVRDPRPVPHFWILRRHQDRARDLGANRFRDSERTDFEGRPLAQVEVALPSDAPRLRERLEAGGVECYEADVRFATRYLIERDVKGSLEITGESRKGRRVDQVFDQPELVPSDWTPQLDVLSLDIETDPRGRNLLSVALASRERSVVLLLAADHHPVPEGAIPVRSQAEMLRELASWIRRLDPDVVTGWNVADFDFRVLLRRADELGVSLDIGRGRGRVRLLEGRSARQATQVAIPGRIVLDGLQLLRTAAMRMDGYSLDAVANQVLGRGKKLQGPHRAETILHWFHHERQRLVDYNLDDARLVLEILDRLRLVELAIERSRLTGMPLDRVASSIAAFDFLYLGRLHRRGIVAKSARPNELAQATGGGQVLTPRPGLHRNVLVLDFKSLYPSLIRTFQIDPLGFVPNPRPEEDLIRAPNGAAFRREPGILPRLLDELMPLRDRAKAAGERAQSEAIKLLMNSCFGVLGTPACRFYEPRLADAIAGFGRQLLLWSQAWVEDQGLQVLYGDTDSLFIESRLGDEEAALELGRDLVARLGADLGRHIARTWRVSSRVEPELEQLYLRLFLPPLRHSSAGAMKRYAGLVRGEEGPQVVFVGLEAVRSDSTELARRAQHTLFERLFADRPVEPPLRQLAQDLRAGRLDELLVYKKALRKNLAEYTATTPPHVAAARKASTPPGRSIEYVITTAGPEPAAERQNPFDYRHYLDKQLRPVAEPVLDLLGLELDKVIGDDRQIDLF